MMKLENGKKLHNHPKQEKKLKLDAEHVIIDTDVYWELIKLVNCRR